MSKEFTIEDLNAFLKTLRAGSARLERLRAYVKRLEIDAGAVSSALSGEHVKGGVNTLTKCVILEVCGISKFRNRVFFF